jgi:radical SAM superfamily enzyme YgiQ (UPF0313 family)
MAPKTPPTAQERLLYTPATPVGDALRFGFYYPANYAVSVSALGYLLLFSLADQLPHVAATRLNSDNLASHHGSNFDVLGISFAFELDFLAIIDGLNALNIPLNASERPTDCPLVFAGGPVPTTNPEPYADWFDFYLIGDGEEVLPAVLSTLYDLQNNLHNKGLSRQQKLQHLATQHAGVYVPSLYHVGYTSPTGPIAAITPLTPDTPMPVKRATVSDWSQHVAASPILSPQSVYGDSYLVEVRRGCAHRCRFCLASYSTLPASSASLDAVWNSIETGLLHTDHIGLLGALIADHPDFTELCNRLNAEMDKGRNLRVSCSSLRADTLTVPMVAMFRRAQQQQVTLAIESGSPKVRTAIHKHLSQTAIANAATILAEAGMPGLKLYTMVGLPTETPDDIDATVDLARQIKLAHPKLKLTLGASSFVPKAATPFQWLGRMDTKTLEARIDQQTKGLQGKGKKPVAQFRPSSVKWDTLQALLARGDRRLAPVLVEIASHGGSAGAYRRVFKQAEGTLPTLDWYATRERPFEEVLPWDHISLGVDKAILWQEGQISLQRGGAMAIQS